MPNEFNKQKQEADEDRDPQNVKRDGFTAEELGEASSYTDVTEIAQQMRRGDETKAIRMNAMSSARRTPPRRPITNPYRGIRMRKAI